MRVYLSSGVADIGRRLRPIDWLRLVELLMLALLALQVARLLWAVVTPVGPYGPWQARRADIPSIEARKALFASFDPFFPAGPPQAASGVVTSLALTLYGIRVNEGSGQGSAIIATPDGMQNSFAVGDEILPGVVLKAVAFDHVVIDRGGAAEQLFIDQSQPTEAVSPAEGGVAPAAATIAPAPQPPTGSPTAESLKRDVGFAPRTQDGRITGLVLSVKGPGFTAAGFQPGDVVTQVNGRSIGSAGDISVLQNQIAPGARLSLMVERGAAVVPIALTLQGQ
ncbi:type II secretion system protein N [Sphingobium sp. AN641]|uniref:type II secretion system protein N n=1 Tax=Sphingobium sp. AN641 TaxID=3133443 RepID=UPI0030BEB079